MFDIQRKAVFVGRRKTQNMALRFIPAWLSLYGSETRKRSGRFEDSTRTTVAPVIHQVLARNGTGDDPGHFQYFQPFQSFALAGADAVFGYSSYDPRLPEYVQFTRIEANLIDVNVFIVFTNTRRPSVSLQIDLGAFGKRAGISDICIQIFMLNIHPESSFFEMRVFYNILNRVNGGIVVSAFPASPGRVPLLCGT